MSKKILLCAPAWLGDMIIAHSLIRVLHQANHDCHVLAPAWNLGVVERMPEIQKSILLPTTHGQLKLKLRYQLGKQLREERYDQAIVLQNSFKSALIPFFADIPQRTGWLSELRGLILNDARVLDKKNYPLMVQRYVALAYPKDLTWNGQDFPHPQLQVQEGVVRATLAKYGLDPSPKILAMSPGAAYGQTKQWPSKYFAEIANKKLMDGWQVWLLGSSKDTRITSEIMRLTNHSCIDLAGKLALFETVDVLSIVTGLVSNDSGLLHVAAALSVPVVGIYGSTSPEFTPPLGDHVRIAMVSDLTCRPCFQRTCRFGHLKCLVDIAPKQVEALLAELI